MGKIVVSQNVSLDGVVEDPTGEEGFMHGGWFEQFMGQDRAAWAAVEFSEARRAEALLLGRRSDAYFGTRWSSATGEWADRLNSLPKYVVSSTLEEPKWTNVTVVKGDVVSEVSELKRQIQGEIVVYASRQLVHTLIEHDLVDELRLIVFPVVLGAGERLFGETGNKAALRLICVKPIGDGLANLIYEPVRAA
jgi:dihydrofolate reductase